MRQRLAAFFSRPGDGVHAPWRLFWVAFLVRLLYMTLARTWHFKPLEDHFSYGFEAARIGQALAEGRGYADPFRNFVLDHTGATAWLPPLYPMLVGGVFRIFGVYTALSAWVLLALNCLMSGLTAMAVWELGARFALEAAVPVAPLARWAGWFWALYPAAMQYAVRWIWEMTLTCTLFAWLLVLVLRMRAEPQVRPLARWAGFGALWAAIALSNSSLLAFLPFTGLWLLWGARDCWRRPLAGAVVGGAIFLGIATPWTLRNYRVFHAFVPFRGNFGAELYLGNGPGAQGFLMEYNHPFQSPVELRRYAALGEVAYVHMRGEAAKAVIRADPGLFARNVLKRVYFFWVSVPHPQDPHEAGEWVRVESFCFTSLAGLLGLALALRRGVPVARLWAWAFLLLPLPYYVVTVHARFRHPLEPMIAVLGVYLFQSATPRAELAPDRDKGYTR